MRQLKYGQHAVSIAIAVSTAREKRTWTLEGLQAQGWRWSVELAARHKLVLCWATMSVRVKLQRMGKAKRPRWRSVNTAAGGGDDGVYGQKG